MPQYDVIRYMYADDVARVILGRLCRLTEVFAAFTQHERNKDVYMCSLQPRIIICDCNGYDVNVGVKIDDGVI